MTTPALVPVEPFWMQGPFAPVTEELTVSDLVVEGELPPALDGTFLRNGPNPSRGPSPHWWFGDGMIHGIRLERGRATAYRNRYVRTARYTGQAVGPAGDDADAVRARRIRGGGTSNTKVLAHGGRWLSMVEAALPMEVADDLSTVGPHDFAGQLDQPMTAHPKVCPLTGELHFFSNQFVAPHLTYFIADAGGRIVARRPLEVGAPSFMHDFAITEHHALFFDSPARMTRDWGAGMPVEWRPGHPAGIGVVPRRGGPLRWFPIEPGHLSHTANAFERDGTLVLDGARSPRFEEGQSRLYRWELDLATGASRERALDERRWAEFPRIDDRRVGLPHRYVYCIELDRIVNGVPTAAHLCRHDTLTGTSTLADLGRGRVAGEPVFVPRSPSDPTDDAGWILSLVCRDDGGPSELVVCDAAAFSGAPVARVRLPARVPYGFHATWAPRIASTAAAPGA
ncbi:MAG TPA: carotenoid oxygenase family protein [Polyangia bacterium]